MRLNLSPQHKWIRPARSTLLTPYDIFWDKKRAPVFHTRRKHIEGEGGGVKKKHTHASAMKKIGVMALSTQNNNIEKRIT